MHPPAPDTIFALSSGRPPAAIAVVRLSGPAAAAALERLGGGRPPPRIATRALLCDARGQPLDDAIVLWFPGPASATGEDVAELHVHGSRAVLASVMAALSAISGLRPAEPGEFTRRAFENGKLDLTAAEALDDLIHADTDRQRRQALRLMQGLLGDRAETWRKRIIEAAALVEAGIDFSDEGDVPDNLPGEARAIAAGLRAEIEETLAASARSERLRDGLVVAIAGPPNAGKSTLLNRLARREAAIVSPYAGTTRDVIEVHLDLDGYPVTLIDTAGIRDSDDPVEQEGVRRARDRAASADLVLWLSDARAPEPPPEDLGAAPVWRVLTKTDLAAGDHREDLRAGDPATFLISAAQGEGVSNLVAALVTHAGDTLGGSESGLIGRERQRIALQQTVAALTVAIDMSFDREELVAEELRVASMALGRLLGRIDVEDILDSIFRDFCIGK